ncbi:hypothetical protein FM112_08420 [Gulosibacter sp. 10]|nr:hypothetical protein FM112_08420 [Gulosibacter sp. 10]
MTARGLRPTPRAWGLLIAGAIVIALAELFGVVALRFIGLVLVLLPVGAYLLRLLAPPRLEVERSVYPTTVAAGDRIRVVAEVRNRSLFGFESSTYVDTVTGTERKRVSGVLSSIATRLHRREGRRRRRIAYALTRMRRGLSEIGPLYLENGDGLGLTTRRIRVGEAIEVEVWPHVHDVDRLNIPALRTGAEADVALGRSGDADDVVTREYRRSDALRRVHWRATARAGELRVRQEEHHAEVVAVVVLDTAPNAGTDPRFELGVSVAASVLTRLHALGYDTELLETHDDPDVEEDVVYRTSASETLGRVMRRLMLVQPAEPEADARHEELLDRLAGVGRAPVIFVTRGDREPEAGALDIEAYGSPAIAVVCETGADRELRAADRFADSGWQVVRMNAGAIDPWSSAQRIGVSI